MGFRRLKIVVIGVVCLIAIFLVVADSRHKQKPPTPQRLWSVDLSVDPEFHKRIGIQEVVLYPPSLGFLGEDRLICSFYNHELQKFQPSGFHVLEVYSQSGRLGRRLDFDSYEEGYKAMPVADGGFVILADDQLRKFNGQFVPTASYPIRRVNGTEHFDKWWIDVSPSGSSVLLYSHKPENDEAELTWSKSIDLSPVATLSIPRARAIRASDTEAIIADSDGEKLFSPDQTTMLCTQCVANFLTNDVLFIARSNSYSIETLSGKSLGTGTLDTEALNVGRAIHASRFVYVTGHYVGTGFPLKTHFNSVTGKVLVVDYSTNKPIAEIEIDEPAGNPSAGLTQMDVALSPSGKFLAVLVHQNLSLYELP